MFAISSAAPCDCLIAVPTASHSSAFVCIRAVAAATSLALNISERACICCSSVNCPKAFCRSGNISVKLRIFPSALKIATPISSKAFAPLSVGADSFRMMFRSFVPASEPLMPEFARTPSTELISVIPPDINCAVPPTVSNASPNCSTLVFVVLAVFAI